MSCRRITNEAGFDKDILVDLLQQESSTYWMVFDEATRDRFGVRLDVPGQSLNEGCKVFVQNPMVCKEEVERLEVRQMQERPSKEDAIKTRKDTDHPVGMPLQEMLHDSPLLFVVA